MEQCCLECMGTCIINKKAAGVSAVAPLTSQRPVRRWMLKNVGQRRRGGECGERCGKVRTDKERRRRECWRDVEMYARARTGVF